MSILNGKREKLWFDPFTMQMRRGYAFALGSETHNATSKLVEKHAEC
jgi:hypothetical protein